MSYKFSTQTERTNQSLHDELIAKAEAMIPVLRERSNSANSDRRIPKETIQDFKEAGFFKILQSKKYGGYELDPHTFSEVQIKVAQGCMSTAWVLGVVGIHPFQLALYDDKAQKEVYGDDPDTLVSSSYAPLGQVEIVDGGFKLSGHWQWSSGSEHCEWALLGALVFPPEGGAPEYRTFLLPREDYEINDTWHSMGLKATGSQDVIVKDVYVPEYRTHKQSDGFNLTNPGYEVNKNDLFKIPWGQLFVRAVSTPAIGATKRMLELFIEGANNKASSDPAKLAGDTHTQTLVADAHAELDAIETVMFRNYDVMTDLAGNQGGIPLIDRVKFRYDASLVLEKCLSVVDKLFANAGGASVFLGSEIQKLFLDVHTARAHVANNPVGFSRNFGAMQLGVENTDYFV